MYVLCGAIAASICCCARNDLSEQSSETVAPVEESTAKPPKEGSSSLFIYLCGSDLETKQGIASKVLKELLQAGVPDDMNIIIETGGAKKWRGLDISADATERYQVKNGELILIERLDGNRNMGDPATFTDFAAWCDQNYRSERNMMIIWDHGAGSVNGVCFDENYSYDSLDMTELGYALKNAKLSCKYDIIGFDACLMATVETMVTVHDYADYMIASQEIEPSCGWELKTAAETFSKETDPVKTGKSICKNYIKRCKEKNEQDYVSTMTLIDLKKTDDLLNQLQIAFKDPKDENGNKFKLSSLVEFAELSESFGTERVDGVHSNLIDLKNFVFNMFASNEDIIVPLLKVINKSVIYLVNCEKRANNGISLYYPNKYKEKEIAAYFASGPISNYNLLLESYYTDIPKNTISFADSGSVGEDGAFTVSLTAESIQCLKNIYFELYETDESGGSFCIGKGRDFSKDWDALTFRSNFRGTTVSMGGHRLYYEVTNSDDSFMVFNAPLRVNGERHNYVFSYMANEGGSGSSYYISVGIMDGYDEHGLPQRDFVYLEDKDRVQVFEGATYKDGRPVYIPGDEYDCRVLTIDEILNAGDDEDIKTDTERIYEVPLLGKTYQYRFVAEDFFGQTFESDTATFEMTKTYEELLEKPLADGEYAAKVTKIEPLIEEGTQ